MSKLVSWLPETEDDELRQIWPEQIRSCELSWTKQLGQFPKSFRLGSIEEYLHQSSLDDGLTPEQINLNWTIAGNRSFQAHNVNYLHLNYDISDNFVFGRAFVEHSQKVDKPYSTFVVLHKLTSLPVIADCSCVAGLRRTCAHAIAVLFALLDGFKLGKLPDDKVGTDRLQTWHRPPATKVEPKPISQCSLQINRPGNVKPKHKMHNPAIYYGNRLSKYDKVRAEKFKDLLAQINPFLPLASHHVASCYVSMHPSISSESDTTEIAHPPTPLPLGIFEEMQDVELLLSASQVDELSKRGLLISTADLKDLEINTRNQSRNTLWHNARKLRITGSKFGSICQMTSKANIQNKCRNVLGLNTFQSPLMRAGLEKEEDICRRALREVEKELGVAGKFVKTGFVVNSCMPHLGCSPDGLFIFDTNPPTIFLVEAKFAGSADSIKAYAEKKSTYLSLSADQSVSLKPNSSWYWQVHGALKICDLDVGYLAVEAQSPNVGQGDFFLQKIESKDCVNWPDKYSKMTSFYFEHYLKFVDTTK